MTTTALPESSRRTTTTTSHGFARKRDLPAMSGAGTPRVCRKCRLWFLAAPRESVCWACLPNAKRALRALGKVTTRGSAVGAENAQVTACEIAALSAVRERAVAEGRQAAPVRAPEAVRDRECERSEVLGLDFRPGVPLHLQLAIETAAESRWRRSPARKQAAAA